MATHTSRSYALATLLRCHHCASPLRVHHGQYPADDVYRCTRENGQIAITCATPDIRARQLENWLIQEITDAVLTPGNIRALKRHIADAGYTGKDLDAKHIRDVASDAFTYTAPKAIPLTQDTFAKFIDHIEILATQAVIHFSIPLPPASPQSGSQSQTVTFPAEILI